ncbi:hypothetical protein EON63_12535 [archaeon]|nr:MAG: hypothetical protein EON63_12535 [archaeon]
MSIFVISYNIYDYYNVNCLQEIPIKEFDRHKVYELSPGPFGCSCAVVEPNMLMQEEGEMQVLEPRSQYAN